MISTIEKEITFRFLKARKKDGFLNIISIFSFIGISLGVAVLIIVMSVMNGFRTELINKIVGFNAHIVVDPYEKKIDISDKPNLTSISESLILSNNGEAIMKLIENKLILSAHDVSLGGIITGISKMCIKGNKWIKFYKLKGLIDKFEYFFSEDQGRYIIEIKKESLEKVKEILDKNSNHYDLLGEVVKDSVIIDGEPTLQVDKLREYNKSWLIKYMVNWCRWI